MKFDKIEIWVHDNILRNAKIRHFVYGCYQRVLYFASKKIKSKGDIIRLTPVDQYEYFFGYYDKSPWDDTLNRILALRVKTTTKTADSTDNGEIVIINTKTGELNVVAKTCSWNVQQGCMLQWFGADSILYNDFRNGSFCSIILDIISGEERVFKMPVYAVSDNKEIALSLDFSRLHRLRPGYGYANAPELTEKEKCPDTPCIWKINLVTGETQPLLTYSEFSNFEHREDMDGAEHKVNHIMINPEGTRFMVLHRWFKNNNKHTRLVTCNLDGTDMYNLSDDDFVSHCCWKNNDEILAYLNKKGTGKGYYLMKDKTVSYERMWDSLCMDGHPTYSYNGEFTVTDTYPDRKRIQSVYIMKNGNVKRIAQAFSPFKYSGDVRCDLHPRFRKDGKQVCIDAAYEGKRAVYAINI